MSIEGYIAELGYGSIDIPMRSQIEDWWGWYTADNDWYDYSVTSPDGRTTYKVERISIKPARMVCQEWASLILDEKTQVSTGDTAANRWLASWLKSSRFLKSGQRLVERAFALGTGAWALRIEGVQDAAFSPAARIVPQRFDARSIVPLTFDEDSCTECAFKSRVVIAGKAFDQVQAHHLVDGAYVISTAFFDANGRQVSMPGIIPDFYTKCSSPLFALIRPGLENTYWDYGPFGVSVFDDALGAVKLVDESVDSMHRDIHLGQKILFLDERMIAKDANGNAIVPREQDQQLFRQAEMDGQGKMIDEYNPELRVEDNRLALRTSLQVLGSRVGLGNDYYALEGVSGVKTATEVSADQSDLFRNVHKHENELSPAIAAIIRGVLTLARTVRGEAIPEDFGDVDVQFDDSIIEDTASLRKQDLGDVAAGIMQPWEYRAKWYGEDEDTAKGMVSEPLPPIE